MPKKKDSQGNQPPPENESGVNPAPENNDEPASDRGDVFAEWDLDVTNIYSAQIEKLQEELTEERDGRREDRFFGIFALVLLLDIILFYVMDSWAAPLAIVILELLFLIPLAKRMGMDEFAQMIDRFLGRLASEIKSKD